MSTMKLLGVALLVLAASHCDAKAVRGGASTRKLQSINAVNDSYDIQENTRLEGNVLDNDTGGDRFLDSFTTQGDMNGALSVDGNGAFAYTSDDLFVGTVRFDYSACLVEFPNVCDGATATITVFRDPGRPDANPTANNKQYNIKEGEELEVFEPGFLDNDRSGNPFGFMFRCQVDDDSTTGFLDTDPDGSFIYRAPRCFEGSETFTYRACYRDYPQMESNEATVTLRVTRGRPNQPTAVADTYTVFQNQRLEVSVEDGVLSNDRKGNNDFDDFIARNFEEQPGFLGSLSTRSDGRFEYTAPGQLGFYEFTYEACHEEWLDCVACSGTTVTLEVVEDPNRPENPPVPRNDTLEVLVGGSLTSNVSAAESDDRYTVVASNLQASAGFLGILNVESDGVFEYGNAPIGQEAVGFSVCYEEYPDLCADGAVLINTLPGRPVLPSSRGIASLYEFSWQGVGGDGCGAVEPSVTLMCAEQGELSLIGGWPSDNSLCQTEAVINQTRISCPAKSSGTVYVECRDVTGGNEAGRQLIASLETPSVSCAAGNPPFNMSLSSTVQSFCNNTWVERPLSSCTGTIVTDEIGSQRCTSTSLSAVSRTLEPNTLVVMTPVDYECLVNPISRFDPVEYPTLEWVGNNGDPSDVFPLAECKGDCDGDDDCQGDLYCMQRDGTEVVPGCVGTGSSFDETDFCVQPSD